MLSPVTLWLSPVTLCYTHPPTNSPHHRYLEKLPPRSAGKLGTVQGGIVSAVDVPELVLTMNGDEASLAAGSSNGGSSGAMGWVPPLPSASELSLKKR